MDPLSRYREQALPSEVSNMTIRQQNPPAQKTPVSLDNHKLAGSASKLNSGSTQAGASDRAELNAISTLVQKVLQGLDSDRAVRIERLTEAVQAGSYHVDAGVLSRSIVSSLLNG
jgi:anti-sigma28 factor (negative regulator of flagellin synthesis)